ncbi:BA14K family protein [Mesorhizobium microcysteis]|uniref:Lectin-like protein BA14k n=1 Tax=Neoaquamicrobium microcysteis TaxID=2682781 RepID=A0A5D4GUW8_9HYPH|nr:BA14K family protein [Mesorhizobium microcysteis]TYR32506.1 BA14K family protein [Mesorhizobium microcysteis]
MIAVLSVLGGLIVSFGMFVGGLMFATMVLMVEPEERPGPGVDVAEVWTNEPRVVDVADQSFERIGTVVEPRSASEAVEPGVDDLTTAALPSVSDAVVLEDAVFQDAEVQYDAASQELIVAHVDWCSSRYRSYNAGDNSYIAYSGGRRTCISPYTEQFEAGGADLEVVTSEDGFGEYAEAAASGSSSYGETQHDAYADFASDHVAYCFDRYRSYRPEDNTYQPFGGGPRRQCQ